MIYKWISIVFFFIAVKAKASYDGYKVIEINLKAKNEIEEVLRLSEVFQADIWKGPSMVSSTHIMLSPDSFNSFVKGLTDFGLKYEIINDNVQNTIDQENVSNTVVMLKAFASLRMPSISDHYPTLEEIENWISKISRTNNYTSVGIIGRTFQGRSITYIKLSTGSNRKSILMDGGIHAREWLAVATVNYIIENMIADYNKRNKTIMNLLSKYDFYFIPVLNPDGYAYSHSAGNRLWRKNRKPNYTPGKVCYGTDLNRNFDANFGGARTSSNPCAETYGGPYVFSELETQAFANFVQSVKSNLQLYMSLHSYAQFWFVPFAYTDDPPKDNAELRRVADIGNEALYKTNGARFIVGTPSELLYSAAGGSYDWMKLKIGVKYSYTIELRPEWGSSRGGQGFIAPISDIKYSGKEIYQGMIATAMAMKS